MVIKDRTKKLITLIIIGLLITATVISLSLPIFVSANEDDIYTGKDVVAAAMTHLGKPYVYGAGRGNDSAFDCSGFVNYTLSKDLGLTKIEGFGDIPCTTGYNGDTGNSWRTLQKQHEVGDVLTFKGNNKMMYYQVALIEGKYDDTSEIYEKPGTIIVTHGHVVFGLGRYETNNDTKTILEEEYGVSLSGNTQQDYPIFSVNNNYNHIFRIEASGGQSGNNRGIIVSNHTTGLYDENVAMVLVPVQYYDLSVTHVGKNTNTPITETEFGIYKNLEDASNETNAVDVFITDEEGKYTITLTDGIYYIKPINYKDNNFGSTEIVGVNLSQDSFIEYSEEEKFKEINITGYENLIIRIYEYSQKFDNYICVGEIKRDEYGNTYIDGYQPRTSDLIMPADNKFYYTEDNVGLFKIEGSEIVFDNEYQID